MLLCCIFYCVVLFQWYLCRRHKNTVILIFGAYAIIDRWLGVLTLQAKRWRYLKLNYLFPVTIYRRWTDCQKATQCAFFTNQTREVGEDTGIKKIIAKSLKTRQTRRYALGNTVCHGICVTRVPGRYIQLYCILLGVMQIESLFIYLYCIDCIDGWCLHVKLCINLYLCY